MKSPLFRIAILLLAIVGGWMVSGHFLNRLDVGGPADKRETGADKAKQAANDASQQRRRLAGWSGDNLPPEGSVDNTNGEFLLRMETFMSLPAGIAGDVPFHFPQLFENNGSLALLSIQLELEPSETEALGAFLKRAATSQTARERSGSRAEKTEDHHYELTWNGPDAEQVHSMKEELVAMFGEDLAMSVWIRGNMDRFHDPVPAWDGGAVTLHLKSGSFAKVESVVGNGGREWTGDVLNPEWMPHIPLRLDHLFILPSDLKKLIPHTSGDDKYPFAEAIDKPGFVISPYTGKLVDVRDIPPGTLVADPMMPHQSKSYFRVPAGE